MKKAAIPSLSAMALIVSAVCYAQQPPAEPKPVSAATEREKKPGAQGAASDIKTPVEEVIVSVSGLYGDWKMVLPEWPGFDKPVTGDFCNFKKRDEGVSIICSDDFLQKIPEVTLDGDKLRMRWGGALNHTIYDGLWEGKGTFEGEIIQAQMGAVIRRFKTNMERVSDEPATDAPQESLTALTDYFAKRAHPQDGMTMKYFGKILEQKGDVRTFPDVFKVSSAAGAERWCMVRAEGPADVRCHDIP